MKDQEMNEMEKREDSVMPDENDINLDEMKKWEEELRAKDKRLSDREEEIKVQEAKIAVRQKILKDQEDNQLEKLKKIAEREENVSNLEKMQKDLRNKEDSLLARKNEFDERETSLQEREAAVTKKEQDLQEDIEGRRKTKLHALEMELAEMRKKRTEEFNQYLDDAWKREYQQRSTDLENKEAQLKKQLESLQDKQKKLNDKEAEIDFENERLKSKRAKLSEKLNDIENEVKEKMQDKQKNFEAELSTSRANQEELRQRWQACERELREYENVEVVYGKNPKLIMDELEKKKQVINGLYEELSKRPSEDNIKEYKRIKEDLGNLQKRYDDDKDAVAEARDNMQELEDLRQNKNFSEAKVNRYAKETNYWKACYEGANDLLKRYTAEKVTPENREHRMDSIKEKYEMRYAPLSMSEDDIKATDEVKWLDNICFLCDKYGISFPKRILYAYHTAFKIAKWSTITVLAGVSGTGKSELPRLYSRFGGFNFINVSVQPNWDSQESMLGFFNSIDNKFDAQDVLKFLYQSTEDEKYKNNMSVVLLDEMNLAHVEHYFADFLSKLEERRGYGAEEVPHIAVSLGAGVAPYELKLRHNILWCGTMNQDETTKSLSDKVLDRGIVINFPRPVTLKGRIGALDINRFCEKYKQRIQPMSETLWRSWIEKTAKMKEKSQEEKEMEHYRNMLEDINEKLATVGRAIGHRVWQSIEHYVVNYPQVKRLRNEAGDMTPELQAAMHTAVEDQLVQKVMPKLRGIDTRGKSIDNCLNPIREILKSENFALDDDFGRACEMGYGQFMWSSAEYLNKSKD